MGPRFTVGVGSNAHALSLLRTIDLFLLLVNCAMTTNSEATSRIVNRPSQQQKAIPAFAATTINAMIGQNHLGAADELRKIGERVREKAWMDCYRERLVPLAEKGQCSIFFQQESITPCGMGYADGQIDCGGARFRASRPTWRTHDDLLVIARCATSFSVPVRKCICDELRDMVAPSILHMCIMCIGGAEPGSALGPRKLSQRCSRSDVAAYGLELFPSP